MNPGRRKFAFADATEVVTVTEAAARTRKMHFFGFKGRWRSWLSHLSNTQKVLSSNLGRLIFSEFFDGEG